MRFLPALLLLLPALGTILVSCVPGPPAPVPDLRFSENPLPPPPVSPNAARDLEAILAGDVLIIAMPPDPASFFMADTRFGGFEHDILRSFAIEQRLRIELHAVASAEERLQGLRDGRYDVVAGRLDAPDDPDLIALSVATSARVLIQVGDQTLEDHVFALDELKGREVFVVKGSGDLRALQALELDLSPFPLPDGMQLREAVALMQPGDLLVGREDFAATIAGAKKKRRQKKKRLTLGPALPGTAQAEIVTHTHSEQLAAAVQLWVENHPERVELLQKRYLTSPSPWRPKRAISVYDPLFKANAGTFGRPWTVLTAVGWQESRFHPAAVSVSNARGVMQLMPFTAEELGVTDRDDPQQSISGGATYLRKQDDFWRKIIADDSERLNFVLASYNAGRGHVEDARALAIEHGFDGDRWESVAPWIRRLKHKKWYRHPLVRYGGCRGDEPVEYVRAIRQRLELYDTLLAAQP